MFCEAIVGAKVRLVSNGVLVRLVLPSDCERKGTGNIDSLGAAHLRKDPERVESLVGKTEVRRPASWALWTRKGLSAV